LLAFVARKNTPEFRRERSKLVSHWECGSREGAATTGIGKLDADEIKRFGELPHWTWQSSLRYKPPARPRVALADQSQSTVQGF
jgi:hypothetical protein